MAQYTINLTEKKRSKESINKTCLGEMSLEQASMLLY
jgi:hypothetical protein